MFPAKTSSRRAKKSHALEECLMVLPGLELEPNPVAEAVRQTLAVPPANAQALWPKLESRHFDFLTGDVVKYEANLEAIELQPKTLERYGWQMFDSWAGNFGESVTALELAPDGSGYRMQTRFARFVNLPELMSVFREIADIRTASMLQLPVPDVVTETLSVPCSPELRAYMQTLVERAEYIRRGGVDPRIDNMLKITNDGRKAALDMRLINSCGS